LDYVPFTARASLKENCFRRLFANLSSLIQNLSLTPPGQIPYRVGREGGLKKQNGWGLILQLFVVGVGGGVIDVI
jgi:hypothetical protein